MIGTHMFESISSGALQLEMATIQKRDVNIWAETVWRRPIFLVAELTSASNDSFYAIKTVIFYATRKPFYNFLVLFDVICHNSMAISCGAIVWRGELDASNKLEQWKWHTVECRVTLSAPATTRSSSEKILPHMPGSWNFISWLFSSLQ